MNYVNQYNRDHYDRLIVLVPKGSLVNIRREALKEGISAFDKKIKGFASDDVILAGVESRTSSAIRMIRGDDFVSSIYGIYPAGEGAGYSGGITTSAVDGIKVAEKIIEKYSNESL